MKAIKRKFNFKGFNSIYSSGLLIIIGFLLINTTLYGKKNAPKGLETVVIDAGHGGKDPGAVVGKAREKDIVLDIALKLGKYIKEKQPDVKVIYTRSTDVFIPLFERSVIANKNNADLFISIHANFCTSPAVKGTETYVLGLHRTEDNLNVAKKENSVILLEKDYTTRYEGFDPNLSESYIMFELIQNTHIDQSVAFAGILQDSFREHAQRADRDVRQAGFLVLRETAMPGVLIESGYLSNQSEASYLMTNEGRETIALSIFNSFKAYKDKFDSRLNLSSNESKNEPIEVSDTAPAKQQIAENKKETPAKQQATENKKEVPAKQQVTEIKKETPAKQQVAEIKKETPNHQQEAKEIKDQTIVKKEVKPKVKAPNEITFAIQLAAFPKKIPLDSKKFSGIHNISEVSIGGFFKYYCLETTTLIKARENLSEIRNKVPDAFIVAFKNGQPITMKEALDAQ